MVSACLKEISGSLNGERRHFQGSMSTSVENNKIAILGCGVMGKSILKAIIASKLCNWSNIKASVKDEQEKKTLQSEFSDLNIILCNRELVDWADVIILWYIFEEIVIYYLYAV